MEQHFCTIFLFTRRYDCRRTPCNGISQTSAPKNEILQKESGAQLSSPSLDSLDVTKTESMDISLETVETPPNRPNSGLGYPTKGKNWCYNCDAKHKDRKDCPFETPSTICIDSVIDFSANDRDEYRYNFHISALSCTYKLGLYKSNIFTYNT